MRSLTVVVTLMLVALGGARGPLAAQQSSLSTAPLTHLAIIVPEIQRVARGYADLFGLSAVPEITTVSLDLPSGRKVEAKTAYVPLPNFYLQIVEPVTKSGPLYDHLKTFGLGVWSLGVGVDGNIDAVRRELASKGGRWTAGSPGGNYAAVDFRHTPVGTTIFVGGTARPAMQDAPKDQTGLFGGRPLGHVGLANADAAASIKKFVEILGVKPVETRRFPQEGWFPYPPSMPWTQQGWVMTAMMPSANKIGIEVIQGFGGPNPWDHHILHHGGTSIMHIAVGRGKIPRDEWLRIGQEKGGKWTNGGPTSPFAYLDWSETLGLVIE